MLRPGTRIGNYEIDRVLGDGGMAVVYAGRSLTLEQPVAIKVLLSNLAARPAVVQRFRREARLQFQLQHPNIVRVIDLIEDADAVALVLDLIDGQSLDVLLAERGPMPWPAALDLLLPVVEAVGYAHDKGVVHRDMKPGNVMVEMRNGVLGAAKVMDFGIAKVLGDSGQTGTNARLGTWGYMAPEQFRGAREVDARADVFALGMLLWEVVAGRLPFNPEDQFAVMQTYGGMLAIPRLDAVTECPTWLADVVAQALSIDPADRFQDAALLAKVLKGGATPKAAPAKVVLSKGVVTQVVAPRPTNVLEVPAPPAQIRPVAPAARIAAATIAPAQSAGDSKPNALIERGPRTRLLRRGLGLVTVIGLLGLVGWCASALPTWPLVPIGDIVYDARANLLWERTVLTDVFDWKLAGDRCRGLTMSGQNGWRLPSKTELASLVVIGGEPTIDREAFPQSGINTLFWTDSRSGSSEAWGVNFDSGSWYTAHTDAAVRVRCVK